MVGDRTSTSERPRDHDSSHSSSSRDARRVHTAGSGFLLAACGLPPLVAELSFGPLSGEDPNLTAATLATSVACVVAGIALPLRPRTGRVLAALTAFAVLGLGFPLLRDSPLLTLLALVSVTTALVLLFRVGSPLLVATWPTRRPLYVGQTHGAALFATGFALISNLAGPATVPLHLPALAVALTCSTALTFEWAMRDRSIPAWLRRSLGITGILLLACAWLLRTRPLDALSLLGLLSAATAIVTRARNIRQLEPSSIWETLLGNPARLFVSTFAFLCASGTLLLALPQSASSGRSIGLVDAAFTSTSAVCVTGLIVVDTPVALSGFGQAIVLLLIQVGGLGIMTFSTAALLLLGRRMSMRHEGAMASLLSIEDRSQLLSSVQRILRLTIVTEGAGIVLLFLGFLGHGERPLSALWQAVFTSISAFCNAGFALKSDSLVSYQSEPLVLHVIALLIIVGGLSPLAVFSLPALFRPPRRPVPLQVKLGLVATSVMLVAGFIGILAFEWHDTLSSLSVSDRIHNAWFQSVTLRTAGFNSVDITQISPPTFNLMLVWMFVGGSPGGTAGGIKTTTMAVFFLAVLRAVQGQPHIEAFKRRIGQQTLTKVLTVAALSTTSVWLALMALQLTQEIDARSAAFEVFSALGTVGLSIGATAKLDGIGKLIIMACMFTGRVGGLTLLMFMSTRRAMFLLGRPEEEVDVG